MKWNDQSRKVGFLGAPPPGLDFGFKCNEQAFIRPPNEGAGLRTGRLKVDALRKHAYPRAPRSFPACTHNRDW